jgi:hypothetical protein
MIRAKVKKTPCFHILENDVDVDVALTLQLRVGGGWFLSVKVRGGNGNGNGNETRGSTRKPGGLYACLIFVCISACENSMGIILRLDEEAKTCICNRLRAERAIRTKTYAKRR